MFSIEMFCRDEENNHSLSMKEQVELYPNIGCDELEAISSFIDSFLKAYGYINYGKGYVFLESVDEEELEYLYDCLEDFRADKKE